jgi:succinate-semialdehyde dehydrogenase/glutarate-semialdehyde dehydrogenase
VVEQRVDSVEDVRSAITRARAVQPAWAALPVRDRAAAVARIKTAIVDRADELAEIISRDTGKTRIDALTTEVLPSAGAVAWCCANAAKFLKDRRIAHSHFITGNKKPRIRRSPYGVVGVISPWNYPFTIPFSEVITGLLAGNAVILKVASQTQGVGRALAELVTAAVPADVFQYVNLPGRIAGDALLGGGIDKLFFTGSTEVGRQLMAKAAETLTPLVLELGGNDPMLVCPDADLERATSGAVWAGLQNAGQSCGAVQRVYVHASVYEAFLEKLAAKVTALRVGPDSGRHDVDVGSMTTSDQAEKVRRQVEDAVRQGAVIRAQALPTAGASELFLPMTVLTNVNQSMDVVRHETFGPVLCVMPVASMDEAVTRANDCELALTASVWSRDKRGADALARRLQAGVVMINDHLMSHGLPEVPWGGFKQSGFGRTHGQLGFDEMTQPQAIVHDNMGGLKRNLWWHPYDAKVYDGMRGLLDLMYARGFGRRMQGLSKLLQSVPRYFGR